MSFLLGNRGFSPDDIVSLAHWYDATKLTGFSDGNSVGTWPDEEGTDDLTQGTGSQQPTYQTGVIGGEPIVRFDGADDRLTTSFVATLTQPNDIFVVAQAQTAGEDSFEYLYGGIASDNRNDLGSTDNANGNDWFINGGTTEIESGTADDTDPHVFSARYDAGSSYLRLDGTQIASGDAGSDSLSGFQVGDTISSGNHGDYDVGEVLIYDAALSSTDRSNVETYLTDKWGIA